MKRIDDELRDRFKLYKDFAITSEDEWEKILIKIYKSQRLHQKTRLNTTSQEILPKLNST